MEKTLKPRQIPDGKYSPCEFSIEVTKTTEHFKEKETCISEKQTDTRDRSTKFKEKQKCTNVGGKR